VLREAETLGDDDAATAAAIINASMFAPAHSIGIEKHNP
jgi:hypothetical protein